jgi:signal transduction histidine kinase
VSLGWDSARARRRIGDVAKAAWVPLEVARLRLVLREALTETEASRHRLVEASAAERRKLERELHDGAQQRIVATGMRLRLLQQQLPADQAAEVDAAVAELQGTVDELRRIAQGVRPILLDDGLAAALAAVKASSPIPFDLTVGDLPAVSDIRALTAYLVVTEAVANVLKHARATRISVTVAARQDRLVVEVVDDGVGGVPTNAPLTALRDRIVSVGGTLGIRSTPGGGTTIQALV